MIKQFKQWFFHLQDFFFEAVVTVNLTTMLVLTTMFISVSNNLPNTAYVKMIDVWLIFNLMMPHSWDGHQSAWQMILKPVGPDIS